MVHHTVTQNPENTIKVLRKRGLSTHYEIDRDGTLYQYLDPEKRVAFHAGRYNDFSIGIDLTHLTGEPFPEPQIKTLGRLLQKLCRQFNIPQAVAPESAQYYQIADPLPLAEYGIYRHSNLAATRCPDGAPIEYAITGTEQ